ncbi:type I restriction-modification system subunit M, partial [Escherichia coli]|uniref:N-6 DNA methylase n=1 Tax=Escherichia coli TaxID=562 RepID=UPI000CC71234
QVFGTNIAVNSLVLTKQKTDNKVQISEASEWFKKESNKNSMSDAHIGQIMQVFISKEDVAHQAKSVAFETVGANGYNLSVS